MRNLSIFVLVTSLLLASKFSIGMNFGSSSLLPLNLLAHKEVIACSNEWSNLKQSCPSDINTFIKSKVTIGDYHVCFDRGCDEAGYSAPTTSIFIILNGDTGHAERYRVTKSDNIYFKDNNGRPQMTRGYIKAVKEKTTPKEDEAAQLLYGAKKDYYYFTRSMQMRQTSRGLLDGNGNSSHEFEHYIENCQTALAYAYNSNSCQGLLNNSLDLAVRDNATFHAFISAVNKLSNVISIIVPALNNIDLSELSEFKFILNMKDGSRLVIDVKVKEGAVSVKLDGDSSRTATGDSINQFEADRNKHRKIGSAKEAKVYAEEGILVCIDKNITYKEADLVKGKTKTENGQVIYVFRLRNVFQVYKDCN